jgi:AraC-like DNA-binding protein
MNRPAAADPALFSYLIGQARSQLEAKAANDVVTQVMRAIEPRLGVGEITAAAVAEAMSTTARSIQRHLSEAGSSYRDVLARVRMRRRGELARLGLSETEIATRLGFANARTMRRSLDEGERDEDGNDE